MSGTAAIRRLVLLPLSLLAVASAVFLMMRLLPGDPIESLLAEAGASPALIRQWQEDFGLQEPLPTQYWYYLRGLARGDLGTSITYRRPVTAVMADQIPATVNLALAALAVSLVVGGALGFAGALTQGSRLDALTRLFAVGSVSLPTYWTGILAILVFAAGLRWLPAGGSGSWRHLVLPALTLGLASAGVTARLLRAGLIEAMSQPHVQVARAKGLPQRLLLQRHVLRSAAPPVVTFLGLQVGFLLAGTAITESVFSRPGLGRLLVEAVVAKDYPLAQGCILVAAVTYTAANALSDFLAAVLDPRTLHP